MTETESLESGFLDLSGDALDKAIAYLKQTRAYIEIRIEDNRFELMDEPMVIEPQPLIDDPTVFEYVYSIHDYGDRLVASKVSDEDIQNQSMLKMYFTIEKMVFLWTEKIKQQAHVDGVEVNESLFYVDGHLYCMRKAFEVIINLPDNWVIMNFDPGQWGTEYLNILQRLRDRDFSYPPAAPRDIYRRKLGLPNTHLRLNR